MTRRAQVSGRPASGPAVSPHGLHGLRRPRGPPGRAGRGALPPNLPPGLPASLTRPRVTSLQPPRPAAPPRRPGPARPARVWRPLRTVAGPEGTGLPPREPASSWRTAETCEDPWVPAPRRGQRGQGAPWPAGPCPHGAAVLAEAACPERTPTPGPGRHLAVRTVPCGSRQPMRRLALDVHVTRFVLFIPSSVQSYFPRVFSVTFRGMSA